MVSAIMKNAYMETIYGIGESLMQLVKMNWTKG